MITFGGEIIIGMVAVGFGSCLAAIGWLVKRSVVQGSDLAVIKQQVNPEGAPALRDILWDLRMEISRNGIIPNRPTNPGA